MRIPVQRAFAITGALAMVFTLSDPIVGAGGTLVKQQMQSDGFVTGVSGWQIKRNGNAEFNNVSMRGDLILGVPPGKRIEFKRTPGNTIDFYSGLAAETAAGHLKVDSSGTNEIMELAAPQNATTTNDALTDWTNDTTSNQSAIYNQADFFTIKSHAGQTQFTDDANGVGVFSSLDSWHAAAFNATWTNFGAAGTADTRFRKLVDGTVIVTGSFKDTGAAANPVFVLDAGYRPGQLIEVACKSNNDAASISWVQVNANGQVNVVGNVAQARVRCGLPSITFLAEN